MARDMERKRAYDRERMARLYAEGETWWQAHPQARWHYDLYRSLARMCAGSIAIQDRYRSLALRVGLETEPADDWEAMAQQNKDRARDAARRWSDPDR